MVNKKEDLVDTYIVNDNGELRDSYIEICEELGVPGTPKDLGMGKHEWLGMNRECRFIGVYDGGMWMGHKYNVSEKELIISDLKPIPQIKESEWKNGLPPVGEKVMCSYTDTDCDGWCDMHGPSDVIAYHGDYVWIAHHGKFNRVHELCNVEFKKPETEAERKEREELEAAYDLYCELNNNHNCVEFDRFKMNCNNWLRVVRKTNYKAKGE